MLRCTGQKLRCFRVRRSRRVRAAAGGLDAWTIGEQAAWCPDVPWVLLSGVSAWLGQRGRSLDALLHWAKAPVSCARRCGILGDRGDWLELWGSSLDALLHWAKAPLAWAGRHETPER